MYVEITERCNMTCAHCAANATAIGEDMTIKVFKKAIKSAIGQSEEIYLGGGEPTLHPKFMDMLNYAIKCICNGKLKRTYHEIINKYQRKCSTNS